MVHATVTTRKLAKRMITGLSPAYYMTARYIKDTEFAAEDSLKALQLRELQRVLLRAYSHVPFYRTAFKRKGVDPHYFADLSETRDYPLLTKQMYQDNIDQLAPGKAARHLLIVTFTGGTTGTPLRLYKPLHYYGRARAYEEHAYRMMGMDPTAKTVYIRGPVDDTRGIYHALGNFGRTLYLSSNNLDEDNLKLYFQLMRDFQPALLYTLPSIATILAEYMDRNHLAPIKSLTHAMLPSENLYGFQKCRIQRAFGCTIGAIYGQSESVVCATGCASGPLYHVFPQFGYTELLDEKGDPVTEEGSCGEIVGTSFGDPVVPFIRYRTGDYAVYTREKCPCGRNYLMWKEIRGREQSVAIAQNQSRVSVGPELLCTLHDETYGKIKQFQIRQEKVGQLDILVQTLHESDSGVVTKFLERFFDDHYPGLFRVQVVHCRNAAHLTQGDKHLYFVQRLPANETARPLS